MRQTGKRIRALLLALSLLLTCAGCSGLKATTMSLVKREGDVEVRDGKGEDVKPRDDLKLYSGYQVETAEESWAWIDLDEVKLTKLDEGSEIEIRKDGRELEIEVLSGSLFFNITEPLEDGESMTIRTSTMAVGIRGTCGWVDASGKDSVKVYVLEGKVRCKGGGADTVNVSAGEMGVLAKDAPEIVVAPITEADIPEFVVYELDRDDDLYDRVVDASGLDPFNAPAGEADFHFGEALIHRSIAWVTSYMDGDSPSAIYSFDHDASGRITGFAYTGPDPFTAVCGYDAQGRLSRIQSSYDSGYAGENTYAYNEAGQLSQTVSADASTGDVTGSSVWHYDGDGRITGSETFAPDGARTASTGWEYDASGRHVRTSQYDKDGTLEYYVELEYDARGYLVRSSVHTPGGGLAGYSTYEYQ